MPAQRYDEVSVLQGSGQELQMFAYKTASVGVSDMELKEISVVRTILRSCFVLFFSVRNCFLNCP